ncbi:MAG: hypothetical protein ABI759_32175 [Candidatus Solibacter sp.]
MTPFYLPLTGDTPQTTNGAQFTGLAMPVACTFDTLTVKSISITPAGVADNIAVTLVKNGADTGLTCTLTTSLSVLGAGSCSNGTPVAVAVGDIVGLHVTQTNNTPIIRVGIGTRCN